MPRMILLIPLSTAALVGGIGTNWHTGAMRPVFAPGRTVLLDRALPRVDEVIEKPAIGFVVRTSDFSRLSEQAITIFSDRGRYIRKIGGYGQSPGTYYALKQIAVSDNGEIWALDMKARLTRFDLSGKVHSSSLFQSPGYLPTSLVLDEARGLYYVGGCVPVKYYLDLGCQLVHEYDLKTNAFRRSFLPTDKLAVDRHYLALEDYQIDLDDQSGVIFAIDAPIRKLWSIDPRTSAVREFAIESRCAGQIPQIDPTKRPDLSSFYLAQRVFVLRDRVVVSIRKPGASGYILEIFDRSGQQLAVDLPAPGNPVGKSLHDGLWFVRPAHEAGGNTEYELVEGILK